MDRSAPLSVLLLEQDLAILDALKARLEKLGLTVTTATHREKVREALTGDPFDLVLLDFALLGDSAPEMLTLMRDKWPGTTLFVLCDEITPIKPVIEAMKVHFGDFKIRYQEPAELIDWVIKTMAAPLLATGKDQGPPP